MAALAQKIGKRNSRILGEIPKRMLYIDRMGLYNFVSTDSPFTYNEHESAGRFVPISVIKTPADQSRFVSELKPLLHLSDENSQIINQIVSELIRNVLEHSSAKNGALVAAQYYKRSNRVSLAICDTGRGIWGSIHENHPAPTDIDAIKLALTPGITGTTSREGGTAENAGAGLFIVKSIAKTARNYLVIYSGTGAYTLNKAPSRLKNLPNLYPDPNRDLHSETNNAARFNGTLVAIDISLDETPELVDLLSDIKEVYASAIRDRKRAKYHEPRFI
jgi:anti-sigma regulatory factor (Ser/Thr protein kinase)